ncbi:MAG: hypothetical protein MUF71_04580 [Candidatus Kapabacteria bacterium]|jgi:ribosome maturation factor RimP|nr:hypothetical protein [Candidatus Kapabacteria bacterium]
MNVKQSHSSAQDTGYKASSNLVSEQNHQELHRAVTECCEQHNTFLIALELRGSKERRIVEVYVDKPEGISLDECSALSHALGEVLEAIKAFPAAYRLDVSSPGVERPLVHLWQFTRNIGRILALELHDGTSLRGRMNAIEGEEIILDSANKGKGGKSRTAPQQKQSASKRTSDSAHDSAQSEVASGGVSTTFPIRVRRNLIKRAVVELEF